MKPARINVPLPRPFHFVSTCIFPYACISGFPRGATPGVPPGTEGRLLRLPGNFIPGVAGIDSLLTIYGLHPRADPGGICLVSG